MARRFKKNSSGKTFDELAASNFKLSPGVCPSATVRNELREGYHFRKYFEGKHRVPMLVGAVSAEKLFSVFLELLGRVGRIVDVTLRSFHHSADVHHCEARQSDSERIEATVLESALWEFEHLLVNDGRTFIAVLNKKVPCEVQLNEDKLLMVFCPDLEIFEEVFLQADIPCRPRLTTIMEVEHDHYSTPHYRQQCKDLKQRLRGITLGGL